MSALLRALPATFTYRQALALGLTKHALYRMRDAGEIEQVGRGVYRKLDAAASEPDLAVLALRTPRSTLCLTSALVRHGLSDAIPTAYAVALPRGVRPPAVDFPVRWHTFDPETFDVGRGLIRVDADLEIGLYSAERSIIDAMRLRGREGHELGHEALRRWLRRPGAQPAILLQQAALFPRAETPIRHALEILL